MDRAQLLDFARALNVSVSDDDSDEKIHSACMTALANMNAELKPLRELQRQHEATKSFAEQYPEQAARMAALEEKERRNDAEKFSQQYDRCWTEVEGKKSTVNKGFSTLLKDKVSDTYLAITNHTVTVEQFGEVLDLIASGSGIVSYGETGSSRDPEQFSSGNAREQWYNFCKQIMAREENKGKGLIEIGHIAQAERPDLFEAYQASSQLSRSGN